MTDAKQTKVTRRDKSRVFDEGLGERVRVLRLGSGMSLNDLAARLGVSHQQMQKYEMGRDRLTAYTIQQIASALAMPLAVLFGEGPVPAITKPMFREAMKAAAAVQAIEDPKLRRHLLALIQELARAHFDRAKQP